MSLATSESEIIQIEVVCRVNASECRSAQVEVSSGGRGGLWRNTPPPLPCCHPEQRSPARSNLPVLPGPSHPNGIHHPDRLRDTGSQKKDGVCKDAGTRHLPASPQGGRHRLKKGLARRSGYHPRQQSVSNWSHKPPAREDRKSRLRLRGFCTFSFCNGSSHHLRDAQQVIIQICISSRFREICKRLPAGESSSFIETIFSPP